MNKTSFVGEGLIIEEYERLKSLNSNSPILNQGQITRDSHFEFNSSFYESRGIPYKEQPTSNDKIYYLNHLRDAIKILGGNTVVEERNEREKEMLGLFSPESDLDHIVVDEDF